MNILYDTVERKCVGEKREERREKKEERREKREEGRKYPKGPELLSNLFEKKKLSNLFQKENVTRILPRGDRTTKGTRYICSK
jgi:hypothetical protein